MSFDIDTTELIYLVLGPGLLFFGAVLLRTDLRLRSRFEEVVRRLELAEARLRELGRHEGKDQAERRDMEQRVAMLSRQQEQIMLRDSETGPYFQAIRHAESGADIEALIERTGVTRAEAELIVSLHGTAGDPAADATADTREGVAAKYSPASADLFEGQVGSDASSDSNAR